MNEKDKRFVSSARKMLELITQDIGVKSIELIPLGPLDYGELSCSPLVPPMVDRLETCGWCGRVVELVPNEDGWPSCPCCGV